MGKYQEVEVKFPLYNREEVLKMIQEHGFKENRKNEVQKDTYYTPIHKNFLEPEIVSEWLRVRETNNKSSINFKQWLPIGAKVQNQCNEYETVIEDVCAIKKILDLLDFKEIVVVSKTRNSWIYNDVEISIDCVEDLGVFIELEAIVNVSEEQIVSMHDFFNSILIKIGAKTGARDHRGYPYLLLEKEERIDVF